tara:strand:- start:658 stop:1281 length:624 start_codon:yes stop_codon:yes gene_type:complete
MKSFHARMYIEDGMATTEFDIEAIGEADQELIPYWGFMLTTPILTPEEREKYSMPQGNPVFLQIFDVDTMKTSGSMSSFLTNKKLDVIKEETIKFLELYIDGKICEKHNYIFPPGVKTTVLNDKQIRNGDKWEVFAKNPETGETVHQVYSRPTENDDEMLAEVKQNLEAVRNDKIPKRHPDGTTGKDWSVTYDKDGNEIVKPHKKED